MHFWFVHSSEVPLREQIVYQVSLGVLSGELAPGDKLPSIRSFARRFQMHANTVSAAYRQLHADNLVVYRRGSGIYVNPKFFERQAARNEEAERLLKELINRAMAITRQIGYTDSQVHSLVDTALEATRRLVLVESDPELVRITCFEIETTGRRPPEICPLCSDSFPEKLSQYTSGKTPVFFPSKAGLAREALGDSASMIILNINSVSVSLADYLPRSKQYLVAVISSWPRFLESARAMLISCGFDSEALLVRDARIAGWEAGVDQAAAVVCDSLTRTLLPPQTNAFAFALLSQESLKHFAKR